MSGAELAARRTAAAAALADFRREVHDHEASGRDLPHFESWAFRLASVLGHLLAQLDLEAHS